MYARLLLIIMFSISGTDAIMLRENVLFSKIKDQAMTKSVWTITFIIEMQPYRELLEEIVTNLNNVSKANLYTIRAKMLHNDPYFRNVFTELSAELEHINETRNQEVQNLKSYNNLIQRNKRSISFLGDIISFVSGVPSQHDFESVKDAIHKLDWNQNAIQHVVNKSLSFMNLSHSQIIQNRKRINAINEGVKEIYSIVTNQSLEASRGINEVRSFLVYYVQLQAIVSNTRELLIESINHIRSFDLQIDTLSSGKISPSIISPFQLEKMLLDIKNKLPEDLKLPINPSRKLWEYYRLLSSTSIFEQNRVLIMIKVPLISVGKRINIFKVTNLPLPNSEMLQSNDKNSDNLHMIAKYELESDYIAVNREKTLYMLLNRNNECLNSDPTFCEFNTPMYPINRSKYCVVALLMNNKRKIKNLCSALIRPNEVLPQASRIKQGVWVISTIEVINFVLTCKDRETRNIPVKPPLDMLTIPPGCKCDSDLISFPMHYDKEVMKSLVSQTKRIRSKINNTIYSIWEPLSDVMPTVNHSWKLDNLREIKQIKMSKLIEQTNSLKKINPVNNKNWPLWQVIAVVVLASVVVFGTLWFIITKMPVASLSKRWKTYTIPTLTPENIPLQNVPSAPIPGEDTATRSTVIDNIYRNQ